MINMIVYDEKLAELVKDTRIWEREQTALVASKGDLGEN